MSKDNRGTVVESGQIVAYNISGQVALGKIVSVKPSVRYGKTTSWCGEPHVNIKVELLHSAVGQPAGKISTVTNSKNLLVLKADDIPANYG